MGRTAGRQARRRRRRSLSPAAVRERGAVAGGGGGEVNGRESAAPADAAAAGECVRVVVDMLEAMVRHRCRSRELNRLRDAADGLADAVARGSVPSFSARDVDRVILRACLIGTPLRALVTVLRCWTRPIVDRQTHSWESEGLDGPTVRTSPDSRDSDSELRLPPAEADSRFTALVAATLKRDRCDGLGQPVLVPWTHDFIDRFRPSHAVVRELVATGNAIGLRMLLTACLRVRVACPMPAHALRLAVQAWRSGVDPGGRCARLLRSVDMHVVNSSYCTMCCPWTEADVLDAVGRMLTHGPSELHVVTGVSLQAGRVKVTFSDRAHPSIPAQRTPEAAPRAVQAAVASGEPEVLRAVLALDLKVGGNAKVAVVRSRDPRMVSVAHSARQFSLHQSVDPMVSAGPRLHVIQCIAMDWVDALPRVSCRYFTYPELCAVFNRLSRRSVSSATAKALVDTVFPPAAKGGLRKAAFGFEELCDAVQAVTSGVGQPDDVLTFMCTGWHPLFPRALPGPLSFMPVSLPRKLPAAHLARLVQCGKQALIDALLGTLTREYVHLDGVVAAIVRVARELNGPWLVDPVQQRCAGALLEAVQEEEGVSRDAVLRMCVVAYAQVVEQDHDSGTAGRALLNLGRMLSVPIDTETVVEVLGLQVGGGDVDEVCPVCLQGAEDEGEEAATVLLGCTGGGVRSWEECEAGSPPRARHVFACVRCASMMRSRGPMRSFSGRSCACPQCRATDVRVDAVLDMWDAAAGGSSDE